MPSLPGGHPHPQPAAGWLQVFIEWPAAAGSAPSTTDSSTADGSQCGPAMQPSSTVPPAAGAGTAAAVPPPASAAGTAARAAVPPPASAAGSAAASTVPPAARAAGAAGGGIVGPRKKRVDGSKSQANSAAMVLGMTAEDETRMQGGARPPDQGQAQAGDRLPAQRQAQDLAARALSGEQGGGAAPLPWDWAGGGGGAAHLSPPQSTTSHPQA